LLFFLGFYELNILRKGKYLRIMALSIVKTLRPMAQPLATTLGSLQRQELIHTTPACFEIRKLARLRVVDNSDLGKKAMAEGRPPRCIHVYNKRGVGLESLQFEQFPELDGLHGHELHPYPGGGATGKGIGTTAAQKANGSQATEPDLHTGTVGSGYSGS